MITRNFRQIVLLQLIYAATLSVGHAQNNLLRFDYGEIVVVTSPQRNSVLVLSLGIDPVLFQENASIVAWKFNSLNELNLAWRQGNSKILGQESSSVRFQLKKGINSNIFLFQIPIGWIPNNATSGYLDLVGFDEGIKVIRFKPTGNVPQISEADYKDIKRYELEDDRIISAEEKTRRKAIYEAQYGPE